MIPNHGFGAWLIIPSVSSVLIDQGFLRAVTADGVLEGCQREEVETAEKEEEGKIIPTGPQDVYWV